MRPREVVIRELVRQWLAKAEEDLRVAEHLAGQEPRYLNSICFHSQQAVEKYLKAWLVRHQVEFPKTHDLGRLLSLVGTVDGGLASALDETTALNPYGVESRYPTDLPELTADDARVAVALASRVRAAVDASLAAYLAEGRA